MCGGHLTAIGAHMGSAEAIDVCTRSACGNARYDAWIDDLAVSSTPEAAARFLVERIAPALQARGTNVAAQRLRSARLADGGLAT